MNCLSDSYKAISNRINDVYSPPILTNQGALIEYTAIKSEYRRLAQSAISVVSLLAFVNLGMIAIILATKFSMENEPEETENQIKVVVSGAEACMALSVVMGVVFSCLWVNRLKHFAALPRNSIVAARNEQIENDKELSEA